MLTGFLVPHWKIRHSEPLVSQPKMGLDHAQTGDIHWAGPTPPGSTRSEKKHQLTAAEILELA